MSESQTPTLIGQDRLREGRERLEAAARACAGKDQRALGSADEPVGLSRVVG